MAVPPLIVLVPRTVVPSRKITVPLGVPGPVQLTVAVKVTGCPKVPGLALLDTARVVVGLTNVKWSAELVLDVVPFTEIPGTLAA